MRPHDIDEERSCEHCLGTGMGRLGEARCGHCKGRGYEIPDDTYDRYSMEQYDLEYNQ